MTKLIKVEPNRRIEIEWEVDGTSSKLADCLQLRRNVTFRRVYKDGKVQTRGTDTFHGEPITIPADEVTTVMAALLEYLTVIPQAER